MPLGRKSKERRQSARLVKLAKLISSQDHLNSILLDCPHRIRRREIYELIKPHLRFKSIYPDWVASHHRFEPYDKINV